MASKNTKSANKTALESMPVIPVTIHFQWVLKPEDKKGNKVVSVTEGGVTHIVDSLPKKIEGKVTFTRLKGMAYDPEFVALSSFACASLYELQDVLVSTPKMDETMKAKWSTLSKTDSLQKWMLSNGTKLYLTTTERLLDRGVHDRNFSELCGMLISTDVTKAYVSKNIVKNVKSDIKDIRESQAIVDTQLYGDSPLRQMRNAFLQIEGMADRLMADRLEKKAAKLLKSSK